MVYSWYNPLRLTDLRTIEVVFALRTSGDVIAHGNDVVGEFSNTRATGVSVPCEYSDVPDEIRHAFPRHFFSVVIKNV